MAELTENLECISLKNVFSGAKFGRYIDIVSWKDHMVLVLKHFSFTSGLILQTLKLNGLHLMSEEEISRSIKATVIS